MAMLKFGSASVIEPSINIDTWQNKVYKNACEGDKCRIKTARNVIAQYNPNKYLLSHCTIIAAVDVDTASDSKSKYKDYLIKPEYSKWVNNNGDAWTKSLLKTAYKTFIGANNYVEHVQIPELSKGKVVDAALREIPIGKDKNGKDLTTYYVDILVATNRSHEDLVRKIQAQELNTLSMGCVIGFSICSKCGNKAVDETEACEHVRYQKNNMFYDENGIQRKVAELCGHESDPESVKFVDASWVKTPAFSGAVLRDVVDPPTDIMAKLEKANNVAGYRSKDSDFLKAASHLIAQEEEEAPVEKETPKEEEKSEEDAPAEEESAEVPEEGMPEEEPLEFGPDDVQKWKTKIKHQILEELGDEIAEEIGKGVEERSQQLTTLDESIIKPASVLKKVWGSKKVWDLFIKKTAGNLNKKDFNKLRYGAHILMTSSDPRVLADFGYNKRDFLAVLSFIDNCFDKPLDVSVKKAVAKLGRTQGKTPIELLEQIVSSTGRKITKKEAQRSLAWLKILDYYKN